MGFEKSVGEMTHLSQRLDAIHNGRVKKEDGITSYYREDESLICKRFDEDGNEITEKALDYYENGNVKESIYDNESGELLQAITMAEDGEVVDEYYKEIEKSVKFFS